MDHEKARQVLLDTPDEVLEQALGTLSFSMPWQSGIINDKRMYDADGAPIGTGHDEDSETKREALQIECWNKFNANPQVNTSVRGIVGRITGMGFEATSEVWEIQEAIDEIEYDPRNRLYDNWRQYVGRAFVEGELYLIATCHTDGFIEIDFLDPKNLSGTGDDGTGIIFHPTKKQMPLFFNVSNEDGQIADQIPSIFIARYDELIDVASKHDDYNRSAQRGSRSRKKAFQKLSGYNRFVIPWNRGFVTRRAVSYLRTTLEWLNHYENLKKFEIDHKKASGAYAWVFTFEDPKAFKLWLSLPESERQKTALMAPIRPGSRLFVPPGMKVEAKNPQLPNISDSDTDLMQMAISGLNEAADVTTGTVKGTYASVKATRGPMSDRTSDEIAYFDRFYKFDFWGSIFFLKSKISGFKEFFKAEEAREFKKDGEPVFHKIKRRPEFLVDVSYPVSETVDLESRTKALLGVKHGPLSETVGIPPSEIAKKIGIGSYGRNRLRKATEDKKYPALVYTLDAEGLQEKSEAEPPKSKQKDDKNKGGK